MPGLPDIGDARARHLVAVGNLVSGALLILGILGMLQTHLEQPVDLTVILVHPVTAVVWFALGVVGVAMCVQARGARLYLTATGALLTAWGLLCLALDGSPSDVFARDTGLVALLLAGGLLSLGVALAPPAARPEQALG
jgi:hypothetical protein